MFQSLIDDVASRFHLGDKAPQFVRLLVNAIFDAGNGGFSGLRARFADAGLENAFASWIGSTPGDNVLQPDQFSAAFGQANANRIADTLNVPHAAVNLAGAYALPKIIGLLTRGGETPTALPGDYERWFLTDRAASAATLPPPTASTAAPVDRRDGMGFWKWLLPLLLLIGAFMLFRSCKKDQAVAPPPPEPPATQQPAASATMQQTQPTFDFSNMDGKVTINGRLASDAEKSRLWEALTATYGAPNVSGDLVVDANTLPAGWIDKLIAVLPQLKANGLKFGFDGDKLRIDTSGLPENMRFDLSQTLRAAFGGYEITGLWDRAMAALVGLKPGFSGSDLVKALNLMNVYFDTGSAAISRDSNETLAAAANAIKGAPAGIKIEAGGHTDNTGDAAANMTLSQQRAEAVVAKLKELGVPDGILSAKGYGQTSPIATNATEAGKAKNRRMEFTVLK